MADNPRIWAVMPAAGTGSRFGGRLAKQYLTLVDKSVIEHSVLALLACTDIKAISVALHEDDKIFSTLACASDPRVLAVLGGRERSDSVERALAALSDAAESDWVLVHDAARPCVSTNDIQRLIMLGCAHTTGAILAAPMVDTVKRGNEVGEISATVDRNTLWRAFTPQLFRFGELRDALMHCRERQLAVTDEASAMEHCGHRPLLVEGSHRNIKITYPDDLAIAAVFLSGDQQ